MLKGSQFPLVRRLHALKRFCGLLAACKRWSGGASRRRLLLAWLRLPLLPPLHILRLACLLPVLRLSRLLCLLHLLPLPLLCILTAHHFC